MGRPRTFDDEVVIERAMQVFWTHGYARTTPALLVEATGLGKSSLYNAFHSKRELFYLCLDAYHAQVGEIAARLKDKPGSTIECFRSALYALVDRDAAQSQRRGCMIGNTIIELSGQDPQLATRLKSMQDQTTSVFAERIRRGQAEGDVPVDKDAQALAEHLATTLAGLRVMGMTHDPETLHRVVDTTLAVLT